MDLYEQCFTLILHAGDAKSKFLMAIEAAREGDFDEANELVKQAKESMHLAHQGQMELIQKEANGETVEVRVLLIHAQDHLAMALTAADYATEFIELYKIIKDLKEVKGGN